MKQIHIRKTFIVVMQIIFSALLIFLLAIFASIIPIPSEYLNFLPLFAIAAISLYFLFEHSYNGSLGWKDRRAIPRLGLGFLYGAIFISFIFGAIWLFHGITIVKVHTASTNGSAFLLYLGLFFIVAFQEEIFMRGYLYGMIKRQYRALPAIVTTSILFALLHLKNPGILSTPIPLTTIFLAGVFLALLREYTESIWLPIGFHWSWNLLQGTLYGLSVSGLSIPSILEIQSHPPVWLSGGGFGAEGSLLSAILMLLAILYLWKRKESRFLLLPRKKNDKEAHG
jgi:membrane protease YdiL (CAAX protease family)